MTTTRRFAYASGMNHAATKAPVIGFTLDHEETGGYSQAPWYALRENYFNCVAATGAIPIALPCQLELVETYLDMIDGLIVTGGHFDIPPSMYGESSQHETVKLKAKRTDFEWKVTEGALKRRMPIFGICGGEQLLNVVLGGTLIQHIPDAIENALEHEIKPYDKPGHQVKLVPGTLLHKIIGEEEIGVNSSHHQAVAKPGKGCVVNCTSPDGVVEGMEYPDYPFCLGVQWHPEYLVSQADTKLFAAFTEAAATYKA